MSAVGARDQPCPILTLKVQQEQDVVAARQRARHLAGLFGFPEQDQTRIATAVSEITRNAFKYAGGGRLDFSIDLQTTPQFFWMQVSDRGPGLPDLEAAGIGTYVSTTGLGIGLAGSSRLMDEFEVRSTKEGTTVRFGKAIPAASRPLAKSDVGRFSAMLAQSPAVALSDEIGRHDREMLQMLGLLRQRELDLKKRQEDLARLSLELEDTNRGVLALYAELDENAIALRHAADMKSRFVSHAGHEFRTPVNSVLALARMLLERKDGDLSAEQQRQVTYIRDAAQQLADLVNDLLDLAKVEAGKTEVQCTPVNVNHLLGTIRAIMRPLATQEGVALIFEEAPAHLVVDTDEGKVSQILRNLVSNALKFTQTGEVRISAGLNPAGDRALFQVKDTGIGIEPADQERIFQEFAQVQHALQKQVKGTGLGLPLSRSLAGLLGGSLTVTSVPGQGSTFTLTLPFQGPVLTSKDAERNQGSGKSILVVDDEMPSRYLAHQLFRGTGHPVIDTTAEDALERARFESPALILLDLAMPDRSGFEVLDELKSDERTRQIPVVIHTSKVLTQVDYERLGKRYIAVLPKSPEGRIPALLAIREALREPELFAGEAELG